MGGSDGAISPLTCACGASVLAPELVPCAPSGAPRCPECRTGCALEGCDAPLERALAVELDGRALCPEHVVECVGHPVLRASARPCSLSGGPRCPEHGRTCGGCGAWFAAEWGQALPDGATSCPACCGRCAVCGARGWSQGFATCSATGATVCAEHLVPCGADGCERRGLVDVLVALDGRRVCPEHVLSCAVGDHPAVDLELAACAATGRRVCRAHQATCSICGSCMASDVGGRLARAERDVCPSCLVRCFDCSAPLDPEQARRCALSDVALCAEHAVTCSQRRCGRTIRRTSAAECDGRLVCPAHVARCAVDPNHVVVDEELAACPGWGDEPCSAQLCDRLEHTCWRCKRAVCPEHRALALGEPRPRYCWTCVAERLERCPTCSVPMPQAARRCVLCMQLEQTYRPYVVDYAPSAEVMTAAGLPHELRTGAWRRVALPDDSCMWERRVGLRVVRIARIGAAADAVYARWLGPARALRVLLAEG